MVNRKPRYSVSVKARNNVGDVFIKTCDTTRMTHDWFDRLIGAIRADGRSYKRISEEAGLGVNFVSQMVKSRKHPSGENIRRIIDVMPGASTAEIFLGLEITDQNLEFLTLLESLGPEDQAAIHQMLVRLSER